MPEIRHHPEEVEWDMVAAQGGDSIDFFATKSALKIAQSLGQYSMYLDSIENEKLPGKKPPK